LALAALRENKKHVARKQFTELVAQFPENPLFTNELVDVAGELQFPQQATGQCYIPSMYGVHFKGALYSGAAVCPGKVDMFSR